MGTEALLMSDSDLQGQSDSNVMPRHFISTVPSCFSPPTSPGGPYNTLGIFYVEFD